MACSDSWVNPGDGLLSYDVVGNGIIARADEIMFARYQAGATTDLQGLQAFDTNNNNVLDAGDALFNRFGVWQDANSDGVSQAGEFTSLAARGIATISLTSTNQNYDYNGAYVAGLSSYTTTSGTTRIAADVSLRLSGQDAPRSLTGVLDGYGLDLDGNGVATVSKDQSGVIFDTDNDGFMEKTAWLNRNDGLLVVDWNGDGKIESASEVVTANNTVTANQGTNRMALLDGNGDQLLNGSDTAFANGLIKVWRTGSSVATAATRPPSFSIPKQAFVIPAMTDSQCPARFAKHRCGLRRLLAPGLLERSPLRYAVPAGCVPAACEAR